MTAEEIAALPELKVRLVVGKGHLRMKLPRKGARWQGPFANIDECLRKTHKEGIEPPLAIIYVTEED